GDRVVRPHGQVLGHVSRTDLLGGDVGDDAPAGVQRRAARRVEVRYDDLVDAAVDDGVGDAGEGLDRAVQGGQDVGARPLLPEGGGARRRARPVGVDGAVVGRVDGDQVVDQGASVGPES